MNIYIVGIGGIGISALARLYLAKGFKVRGSDSTDSELIGELRKESINIIIGENINNISKEIDLVVYTEAVPLSQSELSKASELNIKILTYPQALAEIANTKKLITIAGTHGKSTTTSLVSLVLKNSDENFISIVGTLLKEFDNKNFYYRKTSEENEYLALEACEYNRSYLNYKPTVGVITNIELDHLDYYKDLDDYLDSFNSYINNIQKGGFAILNGDDENCKKLLGLRKDISYIEVFQDSFSHNGQHIKFPFIDMQVPGSHILFDAKIAYVIGYMIGVNELNIIESLENYTGVWRRMERIGKTVHNNLLMSDYGHHPTEVCLTLKSIKDANIDKKIITIFQPHQYSRTYELLETFKTSFKNTDILVVSDIYKSRDSEGDIKRISTQDFLEYIVHSNKIYGSDLDKTLEVIEKLDKENSNAIIILLGAGNIDNLRYKIKTT